MLFNISCSYTHVLTFFLKYSIERNAIGSLGVTYVVGCLLTGQRMRYVQVFHDTIDHSLIDLLAGFGHQPFSHLPHNQKEFAYKCVTTVKATNVLIYLLCPSVIESTRLHPNLLKLVGTFLRHG